MKDFIQYIFAEVKNNRLSKKDAMDLIYQFKTRSYAEKPRFLHPLLHQNTSDFSEQRFSSTFTGSEFFLADHIVKDQRVLPGVAYLEMTREAIKQAAGILYEDQRYISLKNIAWIRPIVVEDKPFEVHIALNPFDNGEIAFEIFSEGNSGEVLVHSQGNAVIGETYEVSKLDIMAIKDKCNKGILSVDKCYDALRASGLDYGPGFRGIRELYVGQGQVLAKLSIDDSLIDTVDQFIVHPGLMDSALQSSIGLVMNYGEDLLPDGSDYQSKPTLPFALQEIKIFSKCTFEMWGYVRYNPSYKAQDKVQKLDVDLCDDQGNVCVQMRGYSSRVLEGDIYTESTYTPVNSAKTEPELSVIDYKEDPVIECKKYTDSTNNMEIDLDSQAQAFLVKTVADLLKVKIQDVDIDGGWEEYGIDSIISMQLITQLENTFGSLPKTLFFEYQSVKEMTEFFIDSYKDRFKEILGFEDKKKESLDVKRETETSKPFVTSAETSKMADSRRHIRFAPQLISAKQEEKSKEDMDIAIIGLSGRYPQAKNVDEFWENLQNGMDCITEIPKERWDHSLYFDEDKNKQGKTYSKWGGFIDDVDMFDPLFFNISPRDAEGMDPQERLFLECVYGAIEDAGYTRDELRTCLDGDVGVFAGVIYEEYQLFGAQAAAMGKPYALSGSISSIANRVSYFFDFHGPSMSVDTMCSSSLTTIYLACQSIQQGRCKAAIAGGINVSIHPNKYILLAQGKFASSKGRCESFGQGGDGYVPGEGVGAVLLKPLSKAIEDGDHIYGIIKACTLNHGGKANGYTVPNPNIQAELVSKAFKEAGVNPRTVSYVEAHGTGTSLGDPIEIAGLNKAFQEYTSDKQFCAIGSVKSNIGHCESAAGIAGVTKVLMQLKYSKIAPSLHSKTLNPYIDFGKSPFVVPQELKEWKRPVVEIDGKVKEYPRIAGISAFGAGGSNAHVVIEEYIPKDKDTHQILINAQNPSVIVLSAKDKDRLNEQVIQLLTYIANDDISNASLVDVAYTLQVGREPMEERIAIIVESYVELKEKLESFLKGENNINGLYYGQTKKNKEVLAAWVEDEDLQNTIGVWITKRKYAKLVDFWVKGLNFDWKMLYEGLKPSRVSLPTYPFARERYWVPEVKAPVSIGTGVIRKNDVDLSDMTKKVYIRVKSYATRVMEKDIKIESSKKTFGAMLLEPYWKEKTVNNTQVSYSKHLVVLCEMDNITKENIECSIDGVECIILQSQDNSIEKRFQIYAEKLFEVIQGVLKSKPMGSVLTQVVVASQKDKQVFAGLSGLLKTSSMENVKLVGQLIELESNEDLNMVVEKLKENIQNPEDNWIYYQSNKRHIAALREIEVLDNTNIPWKNNGIYLITGGAGGLGLVFAEEIAKGAQNTVLILIGRSKLSAEKENKLKELEITGAKVVYQQVDVIDKDKVNELIKNTVEKFGCIDGIIHSAGVIKDNYIIKKTNEEFMEVLKPKVSGLVYLDEATCALNLDFFILFSSVAGSFGNLGQADYSTGNAFMDAYAKYRNELVNSKERHGKTISINWPLWKNGGMHIDKAFESEMFKRTGMIALQTSTGIKALYQGLATGNGNVLVLEGEIPKIRKEVLGIDVKTKLQNTSVDHQVDMVALKEKVIHQLKAMFRDVSKIDINRIDIEEPLESYGIDSVMIMQLNEKLALNFEDLSKTVFYEYQTLGTLGEYLIENNKKECIKWTGLYEEVKVVEDLPSRPVQNTGLKLLSMKKRNAIRNYNVTHTEANIREPIAIIGISGRFPGAQNIKEYWENLKDGRDCITEIPKERWDIEGFYNPDPKEAMANGKSYSKWGGFVDGFADFDPLFFNISPREAINIDPQERLFIESCWECLEDAGYTREQLTKQYKGKVGVFAGITKTGYDLYGPELWKQGGSVYPYTSFGSVANRISYLFNLHGPSMPIDTMCSSSLTAIHEACEHIQNGECQMAIAGGVNLYLHPSNYVALCGQQMLSRDGSCKSFGKGGNGFVPGEGVGAVILKPLSKAQKDGDHIYGVIRGTGINHDGKTNGYTVPNPTAQGEVIRSVLDKAGVNARQVSYIEAHGTGTELGDPIEITGLTNAFGKDTKESGFCAIGSAKSNIGHLEGAAGIAGVLKIVLQMKYKKLVPSIHSKELNPNINFEKTPFVVQQQLTEWEPPVVDVNGETVEYPRIAGISAFGAGGVNAHIIIEEYAKDEVDESNLGSIAGSGAKRNDQHGVILLSAKNEESLKELANRLIATIKDEQYTDDDLASIAYTLQVGREAMDERVAMLVGSMKELIEKLDEFIQGKTLISDLYRGNAKHGKNTSDIDEDMAKTIDAWIKKGKYGKILNLWVDGFSFDWNRLYDDVKPCRISLPTYPFSRQRYWVADNGYKNNWNTEVSANKPELEVISQDYRVLENEEASQLMTFEEIWNEQDLVDICPTDIKTLVCFIQDKKNQEMICDTIQTLDGETKIVFISQGSTFKKQSRQKYSVSKSDVTHYNKAFKGICEDFGKVDAILYLWPIEDSKYIYEYSPIVSILKAMASSKIKPKRLMIAAKYENGLERCYLESWIGFERSLGIVMPDTHVSVVCKDNEISIKQWMQLLWNEMQSAKVQSVMYQNKKRYVSVIQQTQLSEGNSLLRDGGTYLITGGCGGLGLLFAEHLAKTKSISLILIGRSSLDAKKQDKIKELESLGSKVLYLQADVCDKNQMEDGLKKARVEFGGIHGVIHAAGIEGGKAVFENDIEEFNKVLEPKITGTIVLDELLKEEVLDFICYFSSSAAVLGDFGSCNYSIGNRFQIAYAHYRNQMQKKGELKGKAVVINWPLWKNGGMGFANDDNTKMYLKSSGQRLIEGNEGTLIFEKVLHQKSAQHMIFVGQPNKVKRFLGIAGEMPAIPKKFVTSFGKGRRSEMIGLSVEQCLQWDVKELVSNMLNIPREKLDIDENLADFGFDSISLGEFAAALTKHYDIEITPALFYGYSTIEKLMEYFLTEHRDVIQEFYSEDVVEQLVVGENRVKETPILCTKPVSTMFQSDETDDIKEPIAIIGMSGRFPGARSIDEMWDIIAEGRETIHKIPDEKFDHIRYAGAQETNKKWHCGCVQGISEFDPLFFEISPREAETMDPRQRLLLQEAWNALEDAGYGADCIKKSKIGMFVGAEDGQYDQLTGGKGSITSNHTAVLAGRLSYFLNLNGPNMAINTACSSGLVATHQACQSLRNKECDTAIAAGVCLLLAPGAFVSMGEAGMLSPDGKCYSFDKRANGMVPAEAVAVVVLKRLSQAKADGDPIYAVIKGSGINYDGKTNGITAPSGISQASLLKSVYDRYNINPEEIEYIVTHGTGTKLGDPIEINALYDAFKEYTKKQGFCALTSNKTNFGHAMAASGLVSLISLVQAFRHDTIPASLNCEHENDYINWKESPFFVNKTNKPWHDISGKSRTGALSAFGMSGTNVHMVVQSYGEKELNSEFTAPYYILALSAKTQEALQQRVNSIINLFESNKCDVQDLSSVSYTLLKGRQHFEYRCALVIQGYEDAVYALKHVNGKEKLPNIFQGKVARDFKGQAALQQYIKDLLRQTVDMKDNRNKYREVLYALADLYCQGYELDWDQLYGGIKPRCVHLPGYPFARENYWISDSEKQTLKIPAPSQNNDSFDEMFYDELFEEVISDNISIDFAIQKVKKGTSRF